MPPFLQVVTAIRNIARRHRELYLLLNDGEQLRRYTHSIVSKHNALDDALGKARAKSRHWEWKAKEGIERAVEVDNERNERDEAKEEAQHARLAIVAAGDAKAWAENDLEKVRNALAVAKEAKCKVDAKTSLLEVEWTTLLLELRAVKDELSSLQS